MSQSSSGPWAGIHSPPMRARDLHTLYNRRQLEVALQRERARADRNNLEFSLVLLRARAEEPRATLRLARLLLRRARTTDEFGWFDKTTLAALLPYTGADGAKAFCEQVLEQAQEDLIPAICRVYTYPAAWYFEDDSHGGNGNGRHATGESGNGNGHAAGNGNGNGSVHLARESDELLEHAEAHLHGNGKSAGNGKCPGNGNGHGHGNGRALHRQRRPDEFTSADLMPFFLRGLADGLEPPDAGNEGVEALLLRRLPWWKRGIDIFGALVGLVMLSPIMILSGLAIKVTSPGPVIFKQRRAGLGGVPFWIYKFRTMMVDAEQRKAELRPLSEQDGPAFKLSDDPRLTKVGKFLRETSLDELPQLWNVLKGDMSLVGPRPLPMDESAECARWQRRRLDVTPGLTCIWQVKGRSRVTFDEWMRMDVNYIRRRNIWHDVKILTQTIPAVLLRRGAK